MNYECLRCGRLWESRTKNPKQCPKCKSPYWNKPKSSPSRSTPYDESQKAFTSRDHLHTQLYTDTWEEKYKKLKQEYDTLKDSVATVQVSSKVEPSQPVQVCAMQEVSTLYLKNYVATQLHNKVEFIKLHVDDPLF